MDFLFYGRTPTMLLMGEGKNRNFHSVAAAAAAVEVIGTIRGFDFLFPSARDAVFPANESIKPSMIRFLLSARISRGF